MSFDLAFWYEGEPSSPEQAEQIYLQLVEGELGIVERNPALGDFYHEVMSTYVELTEETEDESPWTSTVYCNEECVITPIAWSRCKEVAPVLVAIAARHGLTSFDPQDRTIHYPSGRWARFVRLHSE